jgi:hypothetical protein
MSQMLPWILLLSWTVFFGFLNIHIQHSSNFQGSSRKYEVILMFSTLLGCISFFTLLVLYFLKVSWYYPLIIFVSGALLSSFIFILLKRLLGMVTLSIISFVGWPVSAIWFYLTLEEIGL